MQRTRQWGAIGLLALGWLWCAPPARAQQLPKAPQPLPNAPQPAKAAGTIVGTVKDVGGTVVAGARVVLASGGRHQATTTDGAGEFRFAGVLPGAFRLTVSEPGLADAVVPGTLVAGEKYEAPPIALRVATAETEVNVTMTRHDLAEQEMKTQETQRLVGVLPNFYVSYRWNAVALSTGQKYRLAGHTILDPVNLILVGGEAGIEQATNGFPGYGSGAGAFGKRFGASFADFAIGTELAGAVLPSLFHEDPRYFYKGTGTIRARTLYALSSGVMGRTDKGKWRVSYSGILEDLGTGAISNLYYPASDRQGARLTFENGLIALGFDGVGNVIQEFLLRHFTPKVRDVGEPEGQTSWGRSER